MTEHPQRYFQRMVIFLGFVVAGCVALSGRLVELFASNPAFNGMILLGLLIGIGLDLRRVWRLRAEQDFLLDLREELEAGVPRRAARDGDEEYEPPAPRLLGPIATLLRERRGRTISPLSMRTLQDSIQSRVAESHEISRYLIGLLIFLGLLGTFWGLAEATASVADVISGLSSESGDPVTLFAVLKDGLRAPLSGMGTAFSTSLFGLSGSLVLGFLELQSMQAHNRFLEELEEWLTGMTRLSGAAPAGSDEGGAGVPAYVQALLEQTADSLDRLQNTLAQGESDRQATERALARLTDRLSVFADRQRSEAESSRRFYETQAAIRAALERLAAGGGAAGAGLSQTESDHLRSLDDQLQRLSEVVAQGQEATMRVIRDEMRLFARTLATALDEVRHSGSGRSRRGKGGEGSA